MSKKSFLHKASVVSNFGDTQQGQHIKTIVQQARIAWQQKRKHESVRLYSTE